MPTDDFNREVREHIAMELAMRDALHQRDILGLAQQALALFDIPAHVGNILVGSNDSQRYIGALYITAVDIEKFTQLLLRVAHQDLLSGKTDDTIDTKEP